MAVPQKGLSEDWLSVWIGLGIFLLALGLVAGADLLGWVVRTAVWTDASEALGPVSNAYKGIGGFGALLATYAFLLVVLTGGAAALKADVKRFALGFTAVFGIAYLCWIAGSWAHFAAVTPAEMQRFGIGWSLKLTNEGGYIVALAAGLAIGNFLPGVARGIREAVRPELYIKTAIVILGGYLGVTAAEKLGLATSLMFRGLAAIVEAHEARHQAFDSPVDFSHVPARSAGYVWWQYRIDHICHGRGVDRLDWATAISGQYIDLWNSCLGRHEYRNWSRGLRNGHDGPRGGQDSYRYRF